MLFDILLCVAYCGSLYFEFHLLLLLLCRPQVIQCCENCCSCPLVVSTPCKTDITSITKTEPGLKEIFPRIFAFRISDWYLQDILCKNCPQQIVSAVLPFLIEKMVS